MLEVSVWFFLDSSEIFDLSKNCLLLQKCKYIFNSNPFSVCFSTFWFICSIKSFWGQQARYFPKSLKLKKFHHKSNQTQTNQITWNLMEKSIWKFNIRSNTFRSLCLHQFSHMCINLMILSNLMFLCGFKVLPPTQIGSER